MAKLISLIVRCGCCSAVTPNLVEHPDGHIPDGWGHIEKKFYCPECLGKRVKFLEQLKGIARDVIYLDEDDLAVVTEETVLWDSSAHPIGTTLFGLMDSLALVEFELALEEEFELSIKYSDSEQWKTVGDVISYLMAVGKQ